MPTAGRKGPATIWSTALDPVAIIRQCGGQSNDPTPKLLTEQIKLYFSANRDVLVSPQYRHPSTRNVTVELLHQVGRIDAGLAGYQMVDHHKSAGELPLISVLPQPV